MIEIAPDLLLLGCRPAYAFNSYVMGGVLVDAGTRWAWPRIRRQLAGRKLEGHALTHAHPDHQGCSRRVCETFGVSLSCGAGDADAMEGGNWMDLLPSNPITVWGGRVWSGPAHPVAHRLREGDEVGGFTVIETPGHSPGHVSFWRERDRVLVVGDVVINLNPWKAYGVELRTPPDFFSVDPGGNLRSAARLAELDPRLLCFGHGPPSRDGAAFRRFVSQRLERYAK